MLEPQYEYGTEDQTEEGLKEERGKLYLREKTDFPFKLLLSPENLPGPPVPGGRRRSRAKGRSNRKKRGKGERREAEGEDGSLLGP